MAIKVIKATFSDDGEKNLKGFLTKRIKDLQDSLRTLHETKIPSWRAMYEAQPAETSRSFPWPNASNLVIPIIAIHADTLTAFALTSVLRMRPLWPCRLLGHYDDPSLMDCVYPIENFLQEEAIDPEILDYSRVMKSFVNTTVRYGTGVVKNPWDTIIEDFATGDPGKFADKIIYDGPRPEKIPLTNFLINPSAKTIELCDFKAHKVELTEWALRDRALRGDYDKRIAIATVLPSWDRVGATPAKASQDQDQGVTTKGRYYDIYECHFKYRVTSGSKYSTKLTVWYHLKTESILRAVYDTSEESVFISAGLYEREDSFFKYGFCEKFAQLQEETSQTHNQRADARTASYTGFLRVTPGSKLDQGYQVYPLAMVPADPGEVEKFQFGEPSGDGVNEERLNMELGERMSGLGAAQQGMGVGSSGKRGTYNTNGTLAMLMEGNARKDIVIGDIRTAHMRLGRRFLKQYCKYGKSLDRIDRFGKDADLIRKGLDAVEVGKLGISVQEATASQNKETAKQGDIILINLLTRHYGMLAQLIGQANAPMTPPQVKEYLAKAIPAMNYLMQTTLRDFDKDDPKRMVPDATAGQPSQPATPPQGANPMAGAAGGGSLPGASAAQAQPQLPPGGSVM